MKKLVTVEFKIDSDINNELLEISILSLIKNKLSGAEKVIIKTYNI